ncbi:Glu-tRNA(Gln) amidotransferase subunit GatD, partial [Candidatus Pacearchaeota archaeon]|nr:Glu-tRNA(Gln) amidotransferase subunit GatD [Candidatus Pacearchaeota archaeon]
LDSGYNIGFNKKDILEIKIVKKDDAESTPLGVPPIAELRGKPNIAMIITGGTIAARLNPRKGGVDWLTSPEELFRFYPGVFEKVNIVKVEVPFTKGSEDMDFKDWQKIARTTKKLLDDNNIKGVIITHGTDFLHYTSAALSFFLRTLSKPVVLTYSQRSIDRASSDANLNLQCAALAAVSDIAEVMLVGHASSSDDYCYAMPGTKVRKLHTSKRDAFKVVNGKPFAKIFPNQINILSGHNLRGSGSKRLAHPPQANANKSKKNKLTLDAKFEEKVALIKVYPGQNPDILDYYVKKKYKGIVLELSGLGHAPTKRARKQWTKKLKEIQDKGIVVCAAAQCIYGRLDPLVYSNGREILDTGVIYLEDMLAETALVKLGWVLGHKDWVKDKEIVKEKMLHNFAHEFNDRLEE